MDAACIRYSEIPHTSRLFLDYQYNFDRVEQYYKHNPADPGSFANAAAQIHFPDARRQELVTALTPRNQGNPLLDRLSERGTVAVVTGQQVGLFSGPAYTIYKAITAIRLAEQLTAQGLSAVPVFWLATEDHDFAEINHSYVFDAARKPRRLTIEQEVAGQQTVGAILIGEAPLEQLRAALEGLPFGQDVYELAQRAYSPGATFGSAFQTLVASILGPGKMLFLDPLDAGIRKLAAPVLRDALRAAPSLTEKLLQRDKQLAEMHYHSQVHFDSHTSLVFLLEGTKRVSLKRQNGDYQARDRKMSVEELSSLAEQLSPNALLRPVVQDYMLPTVAYVGGPAELAYLAQTSVIYDELLGRMPVEVSRSSFTLIDAKAAKLMQRYGLHLPQAFQGEHALRETIAGKLIPQELSGDFHQVTETLSSSLAGLRASVAKFDQTLDKALEKSRTKITYQLAKMKQKVARETFRRDERAAAEAIYLSNLLFPDKHPQERYYSILPFLAAHGPDLIETLGQQATLECPDHKALLV